MTKASTATVLLCTVTVVVNVVLWASYALMRPCDADFGATPTALRAYMLAAFLLAYLANLAFVARLAMKGDVSASTKYVVLGCTVVYYLLQLAFLPLVRASLKGDVSKWAVRALLLLCVLPMGIEAGVGVQTGDPLLIALGLTAALHVLVNDAVLFGFLY